MLEAQGSHVICWTDETYQRHYRYSLMPTVDTFHDSRGTKKLKNVLSRRDKGNDSVNHDLLIAHCHKNRHTQCSFYLHIESGYGTGTFSTGTVLFADS